MPLSGFMAWGLRVREQEESHCGGTVLRAKLEAWWHLGTPIEQVPFLVHMCAAWCV